MFKNIKKSKVFWSVIVVTAIIIAGIVIGILIKESSGENRSTNTEAKMETNQDKNEKKTESDKNSENDKPYEGSGLGVVEDDNSSVKNMDVSDSWGDITDRGNHKDNSNVSKGDILESGEWTKPR